jgi:hypothetical protein
LEANELLVMHNLIPVDNDYLLITEAYYPTYRTETRTTTVNGNLPLINYMKLSLRKLLIKK